VRGRFSAEPESISPLVVVVRASRAGTYLLEDPDEAAFMRHYRALFDSGG
jgi:hypothetical protein